MGEPLLQLHEWFAAVAPSRLAGDRELAIVFYGRAETESGVDDRPVALQLVKRLGTDAFRSEHAGRPRSVKLVGDLARERAVAAGVDDVVIATFRSGISPHYEFLLRAAREQKPHKVNLRAAFPPPIMPAAIPPVTNAEPIASCSRPTPPAPSSPRLDAEDESLPGAPGSMRELADGLRRARQLRRITSSPAKDASSPQGSSPRTISPQARRQSERGAGSTRRAEVLGSTARRTPRSTGSASGASPRADEVLPPLDVVTDAESSAAASAVPPLPPASVKPEERVPETASDEAKVKEATQEVDSARSAPSTAVPTAPATETLIKIDCRPKTLKQLLAGTVVRFFASSLQTKAAPTASEGLAKTAVSDGSMTAPLSLPSHDRQPGPGSVSRFQANMAAAMTAARQPSDSGSRENPTGEGRPDASSASDGDRRASGQESDADQQRSSLIGEARDIVSASGIERPAEIGVAAISDTPAADARGAPAQPREGSRSPKATAEGDGPLDQFEKAICDEAPEHSVQEVPLPAAAGPKAIRSLETFDASSDRYSSVEPPIRSSQGISSMYDESEPEDGNDAESAESTVFEISAFVERDLASSVVDEEDLAERQDTEHAAAPSAHDFAATGLVAIAASTSADEHGAMSSQIAPDEAVSSQDDANVGERLPSFESKLESSSGPAPVRSSTPLAAEQPRLPSREISSPLPPLVAVDGASGTTPTACVIRSEPETASDGAGTSVKIAVFEASEALPAPRVVAEASEVRPSSPNAAVAGDTAPAPQHDAEAREAESTPSMAAEAGEVQPASPGAASGELASRHSPTRPSLGAVAPNSGQVADRSDGRASSPSISRDPAESPAMSNAEKSADVHVEEHQTLVSDPTMPSAVATAYALDDLEPEESKDAYFEESHSPLLRSAVDSYDDITDPGALRALAALRSSPASSPFPDNRVDAAGSSSSRQGRSAADKPARADRTVEADSLGRAHAGSDEESTGTARAGPDGHLRTNGASNAVRPSAAKRKRRSSPNFTIEIQASPLQPKKRKRPAKEAQYDADASPVASTSKVTLDGDSELPEDLTDVARPTVLDGSSANARVSPAPRRSSKQAGGSHSRRRVLAIPDSDSDSDDPLAAPIRKRPPKKRSVEPVASSSLQRSGSPRGVEEELGSTDHSSGDDGLESRNVAQSLLKSSQQAASVSGDPLPPRRPSLAGKNRPPDRPPTVPRPSVAGTGQPLQNGNRKTTGRRPKGSGTAKMVSQGNVASSPRASSAPEDQPSAAAAAAARQTAPPHRSHAPHARDDQSGAHAASRTHSKSRRSSRSEEDGEVADFASMPPSEDTHAARRRATRPEPEDDGGEAELIASDGHEDEQPTPKKSQPPRRRKKRKSINMPRYKGRKKATAASPAQHSRPRSPSPAVTASPEPPPAPKARTTSTKRRQAAATSGRASKKARQAYDHAEWTAS